LEYKILNKDRKQKRKVQSIKEKTYPKIKLYDPRGRILGYLKPGGIIDYQELLLKKGRRFPG